MHGLPVFIPGVIVGVVSGFIPITGGLLLSLKILDYKGLFMTAIICGIVSIGFAFFVLKDPRYQKDSS